MNSTTNSQSPLRVGDVEARAGEIRYGTLAGLDLPSGLQERLPVIVAAGRRPGPTLWLTANIHGNELTGIGVVHEVVTPEIVERLRGVIVAAPTLNPTGLQLGTRQPVYQRADPNRLFPLPDHLAPAAPAAPDAAAEPDTMYEALARRVFSEMQGKVDVLLDLHNASLQSIPFVLRDRSLYRDERELPQLEALQARLGELADATGITNLTEFGAGMYVQEKLHRSLAGVVLNALRVPALTVELGGCYTLNPEMVRVGGIAVRNGLRWAGMLDDAPETVTGTPVIRADDGGIMRREPAVRAPASGLFAFRQREGARVTKGEPVADLRDLYGRPVGEGVVRADRDGWLVGLREGVLAYAGQSLATLAIPDDSPLIVRDHG